MSKFVYGSSVYHYDLVEQNRKTWSLTVKPDLQIVVKCPTGATTVQVEKFLIKKWFWLEKQVNFFKKYQRTKYRKEYVSGESFMYLGRQYKLVIKKGEADKVILEKGKINLFVTKDKPSSVLVRKLLEMWLAEKRTKVFKARYKAMKEYFDYEHFPALDIEEMKRRWGGFLNKKKITLNPKLIHTSRDCIDYVITHELCHMMHKKHDKKFYKLLKEKCPQWKKIKEKLESSTM